jgi:NADP-dependent 3-hydroxy acid dehydrogenase YdfG
MHTGSLAGQVAVVTGASSGIGLAVAKELRSLGLQLVLTARSEERLRPICSELQAEALVADITDGTVPQRLLATALERFGRCDVVINNAGMIEVGPIESIDIDKMCSMVRVNVEAAFRVAYTFIRHFAKQGRGHLINVSSVMGTKVRPTAGAYAGTKFAIEALSEALRMEVAGTGVCVTCLEPGIVQTELHRDWAVHPTVGMNVPHPLMPEDVARCVSFVLAQPAHVRIPRLMILPSEHQI